MSLKNLDSRFHGNDNLGLIQCFQNTFGERMVGVTGMEYCAALAGRDDPLQRKSALRALAR